jgi:hypothetical protein
MRVGSGERCNMRKLLLAGGALFLAMSVAVTLALAEPAKRKKSAASGSDASYTVSKKSVAARTALCRADCRPNNYKDCPSWGCAGMHGLYRAYSKTDPHLTSPEGRKQYAECVQKCVAPLPSVYIQRPFFAMGLYWFGKTKESCLSCHARGH